MLCCAPAVFLSNKGGNMPATMQSYVKAQTAAENFWSYLDGSKAFDDKTPMPDFSSEPAAGVFFADMVAHMASFYGDGIDPKAKGILCNKESRLHQIFVKNLSCVSRVDTSSGDAAGLLLAIIDRVKGISKGLVPETPTAAPAGGAAAVPISTRDSGLGV